MSENEIRGGGESSESRNSIEPQEESKASRFSQSEPETHDSAKVENTVANSENKPTQPHIASETSNSQLGEGVDMTIKEAIERLEDLSKRSPEEKRLLPINVQKILQKYEKGDLHDVLEIRSIGEFLKLLFASSYPERSPLVTRESSATEESRASAPSGSGLREIAAHEVDDQVRGRASKDGGLKARLIRGEIDRKQQLEANLGTPEEELKDLKRGIMKKWFDAKTDVEADQIDAFLQQLGDRASEDPRTWEQLKMLYKFDQDLGEDQDYLSLHYELSHLKKQDIADARREGWVPPRFERLKAKAEKLLFAMERDEASPTGVNFVNELYQSLNTLLTDYEDIRATMTNAIEGRLILHTVQFYGKYVGGGEWTKNITSFYQRHLESILETSGVEKALKLLEASDDKAGDETDNEKDFADGVYYRNPEDKNYYLRPGDKSFYSDILRKDIESEDGYKDVDMKDEKTSREVNEKRARRAWIIKRKYKLIETAKNDPESLGLNTVKEFLGDEYRDLIKIALNQLEQPDKLERTKTGEEIVRIILEKYRERFDKLLDSEDKQAKFARLVYELGRSFTLAERLHHAVAISPEYDGVRWVDDSEVWKKAQEALPDRYRDHPPFAIKIVGKHDQKWDQIVKDFNNNLADYQDDEAFRARNVRGGAVVYNPILEWDDPITRPKYGKGIKDYPDGEIGTGVKVRINLRIAAKMMEQMADDPEKYREYGKMVKRILEDVQNYQAYRVSEVWTNEIRRVYIQLLPYLSPEPSISGKRPRELGKLHNKPMDLSKTGEANPGEKTRSRRIKPLTYMSTLSLTTGLGFSSSVDTIKKWSKNFQKIRPMSKKWAGADELLPLFTKKGPRLLTSTSTYEDAKTMGDALSKIGDAARLFMAEPNGGEGEMKGYMADLGDAMARLRVYDAEGLKLTPPSDTDIKNIINQLQINGMPREKYDELNRLMFGGSVEGLIKNLPFIKNLPEVWQNRIVDGWIEAKLAWAKVKKIGALWEVFKKILEGILKLK